MLFMRVPVRSIWILAILGLLLSFSQLPILLYPSIEAYIRPDLAERLHTLRPTILAAAARHNHPARSGMTDQEFAEILTLIILNEHNGWLEDRIEPLRIVTPTYEQLQVLLNQSGLGSDLSIWPTNLRPSVALEILYGEVPLPDTQVTLRVPLQVQGSQIDPADYSSQAALFNAISHELAEDEIAIAYLAANLERGVYRAHIEEVSISWSTLAAWHNQGIVHPEQIRSNQLASVYIRRAAVYRPVAQAYIQGELALSER